MKPMLARTVGPKFNQYPCFVQPKLNGVRALYQQSVDFVKPPNNLFPIFQSRDEKIWKSEVLQHLHDELLKLNLRGLILDGELYKHGWRLQQINGAVAVNRSQPREDTGEVEFHVFDIVDPTKTFADRYFDVFNQIKHAKLPHLKPVETAIAYSWTDVQLWFHRYTALGYEGIMLRPKGGYECGEHLGRNGTMTQFRSKTLWKHKSWQDDEFICVGVTDGEGKAEIGVGALQFQPIDPNKRWPVPAKVGTGLTDQDRISFAQNPPIGQMIKVRYLCLTADGIPFNPSFLAVL